MRYTLVSCDKCGKLFSASRMPDKEKISINTLSGPTKELRSKTFFMDLCPDCMDEFERDWFKFNNSMLYIDSNGTVHYEK
jgi:hypothetical protein